MQIDRIDDIRFSLELNQEELGYFEEPTPLVDELRKLKPEYISFMIMLGLKVIIGKESNGNRP